MGSGKLEGKVALVTGAGGGIGEAIARKFVAEGAQVVVADKEASLAEAVAASIEAEGGNALGLGADVTRSGDVDALYRDALAYRDRIDILVNNVGGYNVMRPTWEIEEDEWDLIMAVNVKTTFLCSKAVIPHMLERKSGRIINFSSAVGRSGSVLSASHYVAGKTAVRGLTWHLAMELGPHGITVNAIAPGATLTERLKKLRPAEVNAQIAESTPVRRMAEPSEMAGAALFLASDEAGFITGATIDVNGGFVMI